MPVAYAASNRVDANLSVHPSILAKVGPAHGPSGAYRAVRCRLTASGTYAAGGTAVPDVGIKDVQGVLLLTDTAPAGTWTGVPRFNPTSRLLELRTFAGAEHGASAATGQFEVIVYGFSG
jgi:hypothetical protein